MRIRYSRVIYAKCNKNANGRNYLFQHTISLRLPLRIVSSTLRKTLPVESEFSSSFHLFSAFPSIPSSLGCWKLLSWPFSYRAAFTILSVESWTSRNHVIDNEASLERKRKYFVCLREKERKKVVEGRKKLFFRVVKVATKSRQQKWSLTITEARKLSLTPGFSSASRQSRKGRRERTRKLSLCLINCC